MTSEHSPGFAPGQLELSDDVGKETDVAGVDEAGRGPLAGPVVAAAVVLDPRRAIDGLADSKRLAPAQRERLATNIKRLARGWGVGIAEVEEIDAHNILQATLLAMQRAVLALPMAPGHALIDGNRCPQLDCTATAIVRGDATVASISAASILAKVTRDAIMRQLHDQYPVYGFDRHKGYPTRAHLEALALHGPCRWHRMSFRPVRAVMKNRV